MDYRFQHSTLDEICEGSAVLRTYFYSGANRTKYYLLALLPVFILAVIFTLIGIFLFEWIGSNVVHIPMASLIGPIVGVVFSLWFYAKIIATPLTRFINSIGKKDAGFEDLDQIFLFNDEGLRIETPKGYSVLLWSGVDAIVVSKDYIFMLQGFMGHPIPRSVVGDASAQEVFLADLKTKVNKVVFL